jgi:hypothetical protein
MNTQLPTIEERMIKLKASIKELEVSTKTDPDFLLALQIALDYLSIEEEIEIYLACLSQQIEQENLVSTPINRMGNQIKIMQQVELAQGNLSELISIEENLKTCFKKILERTLKH